MRTNPSILRMTTMHEEIEPLPFSNADQEHLGGMGMSGERAVTT